MVERLLCEDISKIMIHVMRDDRFRHLGEIPTKDARDVVGCVVFGLPIERFSVARWCLKGGLEFAHAFGRAVYTKSAFDLSSVFLEIETALCDDDGDVAPYIEVSVGVCCRYLHAGPSEGVLERSAEHRVVLG
jgi:hypothetical protein